MMEIDKIKTLMSCMKRDDVCRIVNKLISTNKDNTHLERLIESNYDPDKNADFILEILNDENKKRFLDLMFKRLTGHMNNIYREFNIKDYNNIIRILPEMRNKIVDISVKKIVERMKHTDVIDQLSVGRGYAFDRFTRELKSIWEFYMDNEDNSRIKSIVENLIKEHGDNIKRSVERRLNKLANNNYPDYNKLYKNEIGAMINFVPEEDRKKLIGKYTALII